MHSDVFSPVCSPAFQLEGRVLTRRAASFLLMSQRPERVDGGCLQRPDRRERGVSAAICPYYNEHETGLEARGSEWFWVCRQQLKDWNGNESRWRQRRRALWGDSWSGGAEPPHPSNQSGTTTKQDSIMSFLLSQQRPTRKRLFPPQESLISQLPTHSSSAELISYPRLPEGSRLLLPRLCFTSESLRGRC